jgi:hypothetical protein
MPFFLVTAGSGWIAALLLGVNVSVPYVIRSLRGEAGAGFFRLRLHYLLGVVIPAVALFHAWLPMSLGALRGFDRTGLLLATAALLSMLWQVALGISLRHAKGANRRQARRLHFCTMTVILGLVAVHIVLNRA